MPRPRQSFLRRALCLDDRPIAPLVWAAAVHFLLLASHYTLRPVRDEVASEFHGDLSRIWTLTFVVTLVGVPLYGRLVARRSRGAFLPLLYLFFASNAALFAWGLGGAEGGGADWIEWGFYAWHGAWVLFAQTSFWAFMADLYRAGDAKRVFGFLGFGGSLGAVAGSALTARLATRVDRQEILLIAALLLGLAALAAYGADRAARRSGVDPAGEGGVGRPVPGGALTGLAAAVRSPYLRRIAAYLLLMTLAATIFYRVQSELLGTLVSDRGERRAFLAKIDFAVNVASLACLAFATGRLVPRLGTGRGLAILPAICALGFVAFVVHPALAVVAVVQVLRRTSNYALAKPAREVLFTVLPRAERYRAKALLDASVYRGGDLAWSWLFDGLRALSLSVAAVALAAVPVVALWGVLGLDLGRRQETLAREPRDGDQGE